MNNKITPSDYEANNLDKNILTKSDKLAVTSMICAIVSVIGDMIPIVKYFTVVASMLALIFGIITVNKTTSKRAFAVAGIVISIMSLIYFIYSLYLVYSLKYYFI